MKWKLILILASSGILAGYLTAQGVINDLSKSILIPLVGVLIPGSFAGWIATRAQTKHFLHGFLVGLLYLIVAGLVYFVTPGSIAPELNTLRLAGLVFVALEFGLFCGAFALVSANVGVMKRGPLLKWRIWACIIGMVQPSLVFLIGILQPPEDGNVFVLIVIGLGLGQWTSLIYGFKYGERIHRRGWLWGMGAIFLAGVPLIVLAFMEEGRGRAQSAIS